MQNISTDDIKIRRDIHFHVHKKFVSLEIKHENPDRFFHRVCKFSISTHPLFVWWSLIINRSKNWSSQVCFCFADSSELSWAGLAGSGVLHGVSVHRYRGMQVLHHTASCVGHSPLLASECLELLMMHHRDGHHIATCQLFVSGNWDTPLYFVCPKPVPFRQLNVFGDSLHKLF